MKTLFDGWNAIYPFAYIPAAIGIQLLIRLILSTFSAWQLWGEHNVDFCTGFRGSLFGFFCEGRIQRAPNIDLRSKSDYLLPFLIGLLELVTFPVLIRVGEPNVIGAWIGLKTFAQWNYWKENRFSFHRFLLGNALVVIGSYLLALYLLTITTA